MSLLSDLLLRVKSEQKTKDVPPGLKNMVAQSNKKWIMKRRILSVFAIFTLVIVLGLVIVYITETYFSRIPPAQSTETVQPLTSTLSRKADVVPLQMAGVEGREQHPGIEGRKSIERAEEPVSSVAEEPVSSVSVQDKDKFSTQYSELDSEFHIKFQPKFKNTRSDSWGKDAYLYLASDYELKKDYSNALSNYKKVLAIDPEDYRVMNKIGAMLTELKLFEEALSYLLDAINIKNDYVPALINTGIAYAGLTELSNAEIYLSTAVALEPYNKFAVFNIALLYEEMGNYGKAQKYYSTLKVMGEVQGNAGLARIKERLKSRE